MENMILRDMLPDEGKTLYKTAIKAFSPIEALGASVPKKAIVATVDDEIAGAMFLKVFHGKEGRKIGYLDLAFTAKAHRGQGIGKMFYPAAVNKLKEEGCDIITAMVKDDNVASWGLLERQGFTSPGFLDLIREFGLGTSLMLWFKTMLCIASGMNFWWSKPTKAVKSSVEIVNYLVLNLFAVLVHSVLIAVRYGGFTPINLFASLLVMSIGILAGYSGTLFDSENWRFGLTRGGLAITVLLMACGTFFPILGRWYPVKYQKTAEQKNALGRQAACEWGILLGIYILLTLLNVDNVLLNRIQQYISIFLVYRIIAIYPVVHFGGGRVFDWNKVVFIILAVITFAGVWWL